MRFILKAGAIGTAKIRPEISEARDEHSVGQGGKHGASYF